MKAKPDSKTLRTNQLFVVERLCPLLFALVSPKLFHLDSS